MLKQTQMWCGDVCSQHHRLLPAAPTSSPPPLSLSLSIALMAVDQMREMKT